MNYIRVKGTISIGILILFLLFLPVGVSALVSYSGNQVSIDTPVSDDVFAAGGAITVNAPIDSLIAAGGTITLNAPVKGDVIVAGGRVIANNNIGGKLVAAGGTVDVNGDVGTNALITGGTVTINPRATIGRDAAISGGTVTNSGHVTGNLSVRSQSFTDTGTVGGSSTYVHTDPVSFTKIFTVLGILFSIGWLILGLVLLKIAPARYRVVEDEVTKSPVVKLVVGFVGLIVAGYRAGHPCDNDRRVAGCACQRSPCNYWDHMFGIFRLVGIREVTLPLVKDGNKGLACIYRRFCNIEYTFQGPGGRNYYPHNNRQPWVWSLALCCT